MVTHDHDQTVTRDRQEWRRTRIRCGLGARKTREKTREKIPHSHKLRRKSGKKPPKSGPALAYAATTPARENPALA